MNIRNIIVSLIVVVLILLVGGFLGAAYQRQQGGQSQGIAQMVKDLNSKVVPTISAYGSVTKVEGRNLTLTYQGDTLTLKITDDAKVYSISPVTPPKSGTGSNKNTSGAATPLKEVAFQNIAVGNNVSVRLRVLPDGQFEGFSVIISPNP